MVRNDQALICPFAYDVAMTKLLEQSFLILKLFGDNHHSDAFRYRVYHLFSLMNCIILSCLLLEYTVTEWHGIRTIGDVSDSFTTAYQISWKLAHKAFNRKLIAQYLETIKSFSVYNPIPGSEIHDMVENLHGKARKFFNIFRNVVYVAAVMYAVKPVVLQQRVLPGCISLHCDMQKDWCYGITYAYVVYVTFVVIMYAVGYDGLFFSFISFAYIELEAIKYRFINLKVNENSEGDDDEVMKEVLTLVKLHDRVLNFLEDINKSYQNVFLHQFGSTILAICCGIFVINLQGLPIQIADVGKYVPILSAFHLQLFIYCMSGDLLMTQASSIGDAAYNCSWYLKHQPKMCKCLMLIMQRTAKLTKLKVGGVWDMNLAAFVVVLKTSLSVLAFMQTLYSFE